MEIPKYTFGVGDRFGHEGQAQLKAFLAARDLGIPVHPVWNKSNREHLLIGSHPQDVRVEADAAVQALGWKFPYFVDADHIGLPTVDRFIPTSDFFTLDVADFVGKPSTPEAIAAFLDFAKPYIGTVTIPGIQAAFEVTPDQVKTIASKFLLAIDAAAKIYLRIKESKGTGLFVTEISVDETDSPQTPIELFFILAMIAQQKIPVQTIAPKFTGRFNKGVDYVGDLAQFEKEFDDDLHVIAFAIQEFGLPSTLKLSVHSGSDKFSLYPIIQKLVRKHGCGLHVKTAGTTWLEEVIGLAESGGEGLLVAQEIYSYALSHFEELTGPYATVLAIDRSKLPSAETVQTWDSSTYVQTLRHDASNALYNSNFRQLIHVAFKVAAKMGSRYTEQLKEQRTIIEKNVMGNLLERHIKPIFSDCLYAL